MRSATSARTVETGCDLGTNGDLRQSLRPGIAAMTCPAAAGFLDSDYTDGPGQQGRAETAVNNP